MTDKQFNGLRRTIAGVSVFIGGAIMYYAGNPWSSFFLFMGMIVMFAEDILRFIKYLFEPLKTEDKDNEPN